jgi:predicted RNA-binding Zn-ribbon protein involved in translation (DUF1610 family)
MMKESDSYDLGKDFQEFLEQLEQQRKQGGFKKLPVEQMCTSPFHAPPTHIYIPAGYVYEHVCPCCGATQILRSSQITC